ncbi:MAG: pseudouridine synthase [Chitinophagaceae bacterium]|nr:pseudouridine synthase [Chitinophagaceae bacterium]
MRYFKIYKPYRVLTQFTSEGEKKCLKDFFDVPANAYPVGRLDYDSEGLLIITNDKKLNHLLLNPKFNHRREYLAQVEGIPTEEQLKKLAGGVSINVRGEKMRAENCEAEWLRIPPKVPDRNPPIRFRKSVPDSWLRISLTEGKNRQVRKMTAAVGLPTLRLIRTKIESVALGNMQPGDMIELSRQDLYNLLRIKL